MRPGLPLVVLLAAVGTSSCAGTSGRATTAGIRTATASPRTPSVVLVIYDCHRARYQPPSIALACGDGSLTITGLRYSRWTSTFAEATGTAMANDFKPNRASGHDHPYPASLRLDQAKRTPAGLVFTRATITYLGTSPYGSATETWALAP